MVRFGRAQRTRAAGMREESAQNKSDARCEWRSRRCPRAQLLIHVHGGRRQHDPPTVPPTAVGATMLTKERRGHGDDASGRLAAAFRQRGSRRWPPRSKEARQQPSLGNLGLLEAGLLRPSPESPSYRQNPTPGWLTLLWFFRMRNIFLWSH